jgi:hypothetical protein
MVIYLDINNDKSYSPQSDDIGIAVVANNNTLREGHGTGLAEGMWTDASVSGWIASSKTTSTCQAEFKIDYTKLNIIAGNEKTLGINFAYFTSYTRYVGTFFFWSKGGVNDPDLNPSTWGTLSSNGYNWIPEFPSLVILFSLIMAIPLIAVAWKKRISSFR